VLLADNLIHRMAAMTVVWLDTRAVVVQAHGYGQLEVWGNVLPMLCQYSAWDMVHQQAAAAVLVLYKEQKFAVRGALAHVTKPVITALLVEISGVT
jgi:hypothetical protein